MSKTVAPSTSDRDPSTGRFLTGNSGGGRPPSAKNRVLERYWKALDTVMAEPETDTALRKLRDTDPATFFGIIARHQPTKLEHGISDDLRQDITDFRQAFALALATVGATTVPRVPKRRLIEIEAEWKANE